MPWQTCVSAKYSSVHFNFITCQTIIITQTNMTNRLEEPDSWTVIDTRDSEQEIHDQQGFLLFAAFALSCLESY